MGEIDVKSKGNRRRGRPPKHGGYSLIHRDTLLKDHPEIRRYLQDCRDGLVECVAGSEGALSEQQRIMIDRIVSRLSICRLIEIYIEKYGPFRRDMLNRKKILELEPALGASYLAFSNSIDRALVALGLNRRKAEEVLDLQRYAAEKYGPAAAGQGGDGVPEAERGEKGQLASTSREGQGKGKGSRVRTDGGGQASGEGVEAGLASKDDDNL